MSRCTSRRRRLAAAAAVAALSVLTSGETRATASTNTSFTLTAGTLSISEPATASLGTATSSTSGTSITGHLGTTTINDSRGSVAGWTVTISASNFSDGASHTVAASKLSAYVAVGDGPTVTSGIAVPATTHSTALTALTLSTSSQTLVTATTTGSNIVTYNPTVVVNLDSSVIAGTYTGTITQTVS